jgi:Auxiliary Activity family 9 (formerly GH61)
MQFYLAKVPSGQTAEAWDGSGNVWFKIYQEEAITTSSSISWASMGKAQVPVTLPKSLPSGDYLLRAEHIALHSAGSSGGAQVSF